MQTQIYRLLLFSVLSLIITACGDNWEEEHGYGPITKPIELGELNVERATEGEQIFGTYCAACHAMTSSISGPPLGDIADKRTAEYIINYTLNPRENRQNHPIGQQIADEYPGVMSDMGISEEEARTVYEYLRYYAEHGEDP